MSTYKGQYTSVYLETHNEQEFINLRKVLNFLGFLEYSVEVNFPSGILVDCVNCVYHACSARPSENVRVNIGYILNTFSYFPSIFYVYSKDSLKLKETLKKTLPYLEWEYKEWNDKVVVFRFSNLTYDSAKEDIESKTLEQVFYNFDINSIVDSVLPEKVFIATNGDEKLSARIQRLMQARGYDWNYPAYKNTVRFANADYLMFDSVEKAMFQTSESLEQIQEDGWIQVEIEDLEKVPTVSIPVVSSEEIPNHCNEYLENTDSTIAVDKVNPKLAIGNASLPMTLLSPITIATGCLGKLNGKLKYGGSNYIGTEVIMSTYMDAIARHFAKIQLGEDVDNVDNVPHWGAIIANIDIILSAKAAGTLIDDRLRSDGQLEAIQKLVPLVKNLQELHKDKNPKHYLLSDYNYFLKGNYD